MVKALQEASAVNSAAPSLAAASNNTGAAAAVLSGSKE
jgi:hypothetical protein